MYGPTMSCLKIIGICLMNNSLFCPYFLCITFFMKTDKNDIVMWLIGVVAILCIPFLIIYEAGKKFYYCMPWKLAEVRKRNKKIRELEEKLGLGKRDDKALHYDPFYYKNRNKDRNDYLNDLEYKIAQNYKSPDFIKVINRDADFIDYRKAEGTYKEYGVAILVNKKRYKKPKACTLQHKNILVKSIYKKCCDNPEFFFRINSSRTYETLSECGNYNDYYYINIGGKYTRFEAITNKEIDNFIEDFKREYIK